MTAIALTEMLGRRKFAICVTGHAEHGIGKVRDPAAREDLAGIWPIAAIGPYSLNDCYRTQIGLVRNFMFEAPFMADYTPK